MQLYSVAVLHHKSPTTPTKAATRSLRPKDKALAPPVKGMALVEPALVPMVVEAEVEAFGGVVWGGVDVVVRTATVVEDEDVTDVASDVNVGTSITDVEGGVWNDDVASVVNVGASITDVEGGVWDNDVASVVNVGASITDVAGGVWDDDVAGVEALYATVLPAVKSFGSVIPCRVAQVLGSTPYEHC